MAANVQPKRCTWQERLMAEIVTPGLEGHDDAVRGIADKEEYAKITVFWSIQMLGKQPEYLLTLKPLTSEKIGRLMIQGHHAAIQKAAKQKLSYLEMLQNLARMRSILTRNGYKPPDLLNMQGSDVSQPLKEEDDFVVVEKQPTLQEKIALLNQWIEDPSLVLPNELPEIKEEEVD